MNKGIRIISNFIILTPFSIIGLAWHINWRCRVVSDNEIDYSVDCKSGCSGIIFSNKSNLGKVSSPFNLNANNLPAFPYFNDAKCSA